MRLVLNLQVPYEGPVPDRRFFVQWARAGGADLVGTVELTVRIVGMEEGARLNACYRGKSGPTNVLSFPNDQPAHGKTRFLGDIVICAPVVAAEAQAAECLERSHWAHMVVHGILHLRGFDHETDEDARIMEEKERKVLLGLGFEDPYR